MSILPQLIENKGIISSALGKSLAKEVLSGNTGILDEAVALLEHESKNVRAGAAKIVEQAAVGDPAMVVRLMPHLLPALDLPELQTRWMAIHTLGLCASLDPQTAMMAFPKAQQFMERDSGVCLWGATIKYLGYLGSTSSAEAQRVFPLLMRAHDELSNLQRMILDCFLQLHSEADESMVQKLGLLAGRHLDDAKPSVRRAARKLAKAISSHSGR
jgi:hypothetical protein